MKYAIKNRKTGEYYNYSHTDENFQAIGESTVANIEDGYAVCFSVAEKIIAKDVVEAEDWKVEAIS